MSTYRLDLYQQLLPLTALWGARIPVRMCEANFSALFPRPFAPPRRFAQNSCMSCKLRPCAPGHWERCADIGRRAVFPKIHEIKAWLRTFASSFIIQKCRKRRYTFCRCTMGVKIALVHNVRCCNYIPLIHAV
jgi:hypothetical protein